MTTPYTAGAASVTAGNPVVTGIGTAWQTALIPGGMFGIDSANGNPVPILSIDSDTQLTLALPWRGSSASGQAYWIVRDTAPGQQTVANAGALAQIIADLRSAVLAALAGLVPETDTLPIFRSGGTAELISVDDLYPTLGDLGVSSFVAELLNEPSAAGFLSGLGLSDFVQSILDDPNGSTVLQSLGVSDFVRTLLDDADAASVYGTLGQIPNAQVRADLTPDKAFRRGNILGAVDQLSGVPSGAILEYGSNANGEYLRMADGTQICWGVVNHDSAAATTAFGALYGVAGGFTKTYPAVFAAAPAVTLTGMRNGDFAIGGTVRLNTSLGSFTYNLWSSASLGSSFTKSIAWQANGRWI